MAFLNSRQAAQKLQMHIVVEQPLSALSHGRITCQPVGRAPITFAWSDANGRSPQLDSSGSQAFGVTEGRYVVTATDADGLQSVNHIDIQPLCPDALVVQEYHVQHASTGEARDGTVSALGLNLETWSRYLWTNGVETDVAVLHDVPVGVYALVPLPSHERVPTFIHQCQPAVVRATAV